MERELHGAELGYLVVELELNSPNLWYTMYTRSSLPILSERFFNTIINETCCLSNSRETKLGNGPTTTYKAEPPPEAGDGAYIYVRAR
jgi:hypothetical protein